MTMWCFSDCFCSCCDPFAVAAAVVVIVTVVVSDQKPTRKSEREGERVCLCVVCVSLSSQNTLYIPHGAIQLTMRLN